ncbi:hypothetical protein K1719_016911 [Acacia pycnantha]|nr:hypothetical protein K1719_045001 [Acacia pycnantha]KAI9112015.1 hypothetical protein K1719_016911 [Acacia pycnantha]
MSRGKKHITLPSSEYNDDEKKIFRRETERKRRQQMTTLCESLRCLLPFERIKGKRSASDHLGEAASYIKYLEEKNQELQIKRDKLKQEASQSLFGEDSGLEENSFPLSLLLEILTQEGCNVVSCVSTQVNGRLYHSIKAEVNNLESLDIAGLEQKLNGAIFWSIKDLH